ncbi:glycosyltransferase family 4 protein [Microvirga ossetica]|uniref:glycosyltransferase family 4 protein n=1 Tax=Microvirga ossetica TaxID=1882682 RepID=UPI000C159D50|nr:glycosyltransferase family 4 protein [Microvirga ossetica]
MRILVYPHELTIGGSQINAIDLAAGIADAGHEVLIYGRTGPLVEYIKDRNLEFLPAHPLKYRPAPSRIIQLAEITRRRQIDLIHTYEWPGCLDAYFGAGLFLGVPLLCTVLSMSVMPYVPAAVPLIMGTEELGREAREVQHSNVWVLEPPINVDSDHPGIDGSDFRRTHGVSEHDLLIVGVSRFAPDLKLDSLVRAIDAADLLAGQYPIKLVLVGGGSAFDSLLERARAVNVRWEREVVALPGPTLDPRAAYAAADIVIGMGSSALRALAIGRPLIVQGEEAFSAIFNPETLNLFLKQGFYGLADGAAGATRLAEQLESLLANPDRREELGRFGREVVVQRFSLDRAVQVQLGIYTEILAHPNRYKVIDSVRSAYRALELEVQNHMPRVKLHKKRREEMLLAAARQGLWPPEAHYNYPKIHKWHFGSGVTSQEHSLLKSSKRSHGGG